MLVVVGVGGGIGWSITVEWCAVVDVDDGRSRWASVVGCRELLVGRGEHRCQIGVCVVVELLRPSQSDEV
jgi:hypothetical protein